jgi:hypothetical protein
MRYTIRITAEDIRMGRPRNGPSCPIALAAVRAIGDAGLWVYDDAIELSSGETGPLPAEARDFVGRFDRRETVVPFAFEVDVT